MTHRTLAPAVAAVLFPLAAFGQTMDGKGRGLDALDESAVIARLNSDGLTTLLDRDLDLFKVPPAEREAIKGASGLRDLANAGGLKPADRRAVAARVAKGLDQTVAKATDVTELLKQAYQLTSAGVEPTVNELQYFGENPVAQAQLEPVATTVRHMLDKALSLAQARVDQIANGIGNNNFATEQPKLRAAGQLKLQAQYGNARMAYPYCLSLKKSDPRRQTAADEAIAALQRFDNPKSTVQGSVRVVIGKLQLLKGDYPTAKATLGSVSGGGVVPPASGADQNDARYFTAVADLDAGDFAAATAGLKDLVNWQAGAYLPSLPAGGQDAVKAANAMLEARIASAQADAAGAGPDKDKFNAQAVQVLSDLLASNADPTLRDLVFDQLSSRIDPSAPLAQMNALVLSAVEQLAIDEYNKPDGQPIDAAKMNRGLDAAREMSRRDGQPGVNHAAAVEAQYFVAYAVQGKLHDEAGAADAFMDFMQRFPNEGERSTDAMEHAGAIVFKLHREAVAKQQPDPVQQKLYDRFLPLAIAAPYNQKQIAIEYADLLRTQGKYPEALSYYAQVPTTDKRYATAQYDTLLTLYAALGDARSTASADQKQTMAVQLQATADAVVKQTEGVLTATPSAVAPEHQEALFQRAVARFDAAVSARRDLKDAGKAVARLDGIEALVAPLTLRNPDGSTVADGFVRAAQVQRVQNLMALGKTADAAKVLVKVLDTNPQAGEGLMFDLIQQIDHDLEVAQAAKDVPAQRELAANKATLTGFLVTYAQNSQTPDVHNQLDAYRLYDADSKRQAAALADAGPNRIANLRAALAQYQALLANKPAGDMLAQVQLGIGQTQFALGDFKAAAANLAPLVTGKKVGLPMVKVDGHDAANPQFWDATFAYLRSMLEVAKADPGNATAKTNATAAGGYLNTLLAIHGARAGRHDDLVKLQADFKAFAGAKK